MIGLLFFVLAVLASPFKSKLRLEAENAVLRHQLIVLRRKLHGRVRLTNHDRWLQMPPNINRSIETNRSLSGLARRSTLICCLSTRISASCDTRDRNRSRAIAKINRHKSSIGASIARFSVNCQHD
jgi:hypothetical protein